MVEAGAKGVTRRGRGVSGLENGYDEREGRRGEILGREGNRERKERR